MRKEGLTEGTDLEKPRRNLLIVSCVLIVAELADVRISAINVPGLSVYLERPEVILPFIWMMLIYSAWRFWLIAKPSYRPFQRRADKFINKSTHAKSAIVQRGHDLHETQFTDNNPQVIRKLFKRELRFRKLNASGEPGHEIAVKLNYLKIIFPELRGDIKCILTDKQFDEYTLPFIVAVVPVCIAIVKSLMCLSV